MGAPRAKVSRNVKLSHAEFLITRPEGGNRLTLNMRRRENVNWHWTTLTDEEVKSLIGELLVTL
jgi:hypothetical protein